MQDTLNRVKQAAAHVRLSVKKLYEPSLQNIENNTIVLADTSAGKRLFCIGHCDLFHGVSVQNGDGLVQICELTPENARVLRKIFPWTAPKPVGLQTSFGAGDRIGVATPGHIRALRPYKVMPVLAQQSIREMDRTVRQSQDVMDDACWAVFQEGFRDGFGSDADHLKTEADIRNTVAAGFVGFTVDPSDHINNNADEMTDGTLDSAFDGLFDSPTDAADFLKRYAEQELTATGKERIVKIKMSSTELKQLAVKYLPAIRHTVSMHQLLQDLMGDQEFDFEMSVDETETPTTVAAHYIVANELKKAGVECTSLAPRFIGEFQKAIDYIGDLDKFREQFREHVVIAEHFGPYKLSIHSGSDKYSVFPIVGEETNGLFHEKTAGASYLEAIRIVARKAPDLFREIFQFAKTRFEEERYSYHVTTNMDNVPDVAILKDDQLEALLDDDDPRQVLHITFGGTLTAKRDDGGYTFRNRILDVLDEFEEDYYDALVLLFSRHADAFGIARK